MKFFLCQDLIRKNFDAINVLNKIKEEKFKVKLGIFIIHICKNIIRILLKEKDPKKFSRTNKFYLVSIWTDIEVLQNEDYLKKFVNHKK